MKAEITFEKGLATTNQAVSKSSVEIILGDVYKGKDGDSAYKIAVENGFIGTESEWLESLKAKTDTELDSDSHNAIANSAVTEAITELESENVSINTNIDTLRNNVTVLLGRKLESTNLIATQNPIFLKNRYYSPSAGDFINREGYNCHVWIEIEPNTHLYGIGAAYEFDENKEYLNLWHGSADMKTNFNFVTSENCRYLVLSYADTPQYIQPGTENTNGYWVSTLNGTQKNSIKEEYLDIEKQIKNSADIQNIQKENDPIFKGCKMVQSHGDVIDFSEVTIVAVSVYQIIECT